MAEISAKGRDLVAEYADAVDAHNGPRSSEKGVALRAYIAELEQDRARLDWLEQNRTKHHFWMGGDNQPDVIICPWGADLIVGRGHALREAIDAAREATNA